MKSFFIFLILFIQVLFSSDNPLHIRGVVHAPTGQFFLQKTDTVITGFEPIPISRAYVSDSVLGFNWKGGWTFFPHTEFYLEFENGHPTARIQESDGAVVEYHYDFFSDAMVPDLDKHFSPPFGKEISGRTDIRNNRLVFSTLKGDSLQKATLYLGNGGQRIYHSVRNGAGGPKVLFLLTEEIKPNGNLIQYSYNRDERLKEIKTLNPSKTKVYATAQFRYQGHKEKDRNFTITGSDQNQIEYHFLRPEEKQLHNYFYLRAVVGDTVREDFSYDMGYPAKNHEEIDRVKKEIHNAKEAKKHELKNKLARYRAQNKWRAPFVSEVSLGQIPLFQITYYKPLINDSEFWGMKNIPKANHPDCEKVLNLKEPVGPNGEMMTTHSFCYEPHCTKVKDPYGNETHYYYSDHFRPTRIDFFAPQKLIRSEIFSWEGPDLKSHAFLDPTEENSFSYEYKHDSRGNIIQETFVSNSIRTVTSFEYSYDGFNLLTKKVDPEGTVTLFSYKPGTDRLTSKLIYANGKIAIRHTYKYNDDHFLLEEIVDDGNSEIAKIIRYTPNEKNLVATVEEFGYDPTQRNEILIQKRKFHYNSKNQIEKVEVDTGNFDKNFELLTTYENGQVKTQSDPLGFVTTFEYNSRDQVVRKQKDKGPIETFAYKPTGLLAAYQLQDPLTLETQVISYEYDALLHKTAETNPYGKTTQFNHDRFGNLTSLSIDDKTSTTTYDFLGRPIQQTDPKGYKTQTIYNPRGDPIRIIHPTGEESFVYDEVGRLKEHIDLEGLPSYYEYDPLQRVICKSNPFSKEEKTYSSFHLLTETDLNGYTTEYKYDFAGRKISEEKAGRKTTFSYDSLGFLEKTTQEDLISVTKRDKVGQILEESTQHIQGETLQRKLYAYNPLGHLVTETHYTAAGTSHFTSKYDSFGRIIETTDPLGHTTKLIYTQNPHTTTTVDPLGFKTIESFNSHGQPEKREKRNSSGNTIFLEEYFFDSNGNKERQRSTIYYQNTPQKVIETLWKYGPGNRLEELTESSNTPSARKTSYSYTPSGLLKQTTKPDGTTLDYSYTPLKSLNTLKSSDGSIHYLYEHDPLGKLLSVTDLNTGAWTDRTLDPFGNILLENLANNLQISKRYNALDQCTQLVLPDQSTVEKKYQATQLKEINRFDPDHQFLYAHKFTQYDLSGNLVTEELPLNIGHTHYQVDVLGRYTQVNAPHYSQSIDQFDPIGKIKQLSTQGISTKFDHDDLGQIILENHDTFAYDSNYNRLLHNNAPEIIDDLNQLIATETTTYTYDLCGRLKIKSTPSEIIHFTYDPLDRLTSVEKSDNTRVSYTYDPLHRRLSKTTPKTTTHYLYDGQNEIGQIENGKLTLRILGHTPFAEIGAAIAIEIKGKPYIPIHDLQGSLTLLIDPQTRTPIETSNYSAFGVESNSSELSPWGYLSKTKDPETDFIFFGRRYYDPSLGRWMTPDPKGYTDSMNLYAFALNDPFLLVDPYGLENDLSSMSKSAGIGAFGGAAQGFFHPIDSAWAISGDLSGLIHSAAAWDFSYYSSNWQSMNWDQKLRLISFKTGQAGGLIGAATWVIPKAGWSILQGTWQGARYLVSGARIGITNITSRFTFQEVNRDSLRWSAARYVVKESSAASKEILVFSDQKFAKQLAEQLTKHGPKSVIKSYKSLEKNLSEHIKKLPELKYKSSVEREIRAFENQIDTLKKFAETHNIELP